MRDVTFCRFVCFVCTSRLVRCRGMKVSFAVEVGENASALGGRSVCVEVV